MKYLLDTNIISAVRKKENNPNVRMLIASFPEESLHISVLSIGEMRKGIEKLLNQQKKEELEAWLNHILTDWLKGKILNIDVPIMNQWGCLVAKHRTLPLIDSILAATAITHNLTLVTRNTKDFHDIKELKIINPFL